MKKKKACWEMNAKELATATEQFDEPFVVDKSRPLSPAERQQWKRVSRKPGRPKSGKGFKRVSLSIEQDLLLRVTNLAKARRISRSRLVALVLTEALAGEQQRKRS
jgi:hypothetical protein